jgi:hypothetical protein
MKIHRIQFATGWFSPSIFFTIVFITLLCLSIIGLPFGIALIPTLYRIAEESEQPTVHLESN